MLWQDGLLDLIKILSDWMKFILDISDEKTIIAVKEKYSSPKFVDENKVVSVIIFREPVVGVNR